MAAEVDFETKSVCVGRYVVDVPVQLRRQLKGAGQGGDATFYFGHDHNFTKVDATVIDGRGKDTFESELVARESTLRAQEHFVTNGSMFVSRERTAPDTELISSYASSESTDAIRLELHALLGEAHVVLGEISYSAETRAGIQSRLRSMLAAARVENGPVAGQPGFCVGSVAFDVGNDYEEADLTYAGRIDGVFVGLQFDINTFEQDPAEPDLVERGEANLEGLGVSPQKLRAGKRTLAGDAGEEWLGAFVEDDRRLHGFYAETKTSKPSRQAPKLLVSLSTGDEEDSASRANMDDVFAIALWERVLNSIRKRII